MPVLQVYFPTQEEIEKVKKQAEAQGFKSAAEFIRNKLKDAKNG